MVLRFGSEVNALLTGALRLGTTLAQFTPRKLRGRISASSEQVRFWARDLPQAGNQSRIATANEYVK